MKVRPLIERIADQERRISDLRVRLTDRIQRSTRYYTRPLKAVDDLRAELREAESKLNQLRSEHVKQQRAPAPNQGESP